MELKPNLREQILRDMPSALLMRWEIHQLPGEDKWSHRFMVCVEGGGTNMKYDPPYLLETYWKPWAEYVVMLHNKSLER